MPTVSVILPTCDRPALWPRALGSILRQTWTDFEVLLVDSNRRTPPVREHPAFAAVRSDARIRLLEDRHDASSSAARNVGLRAARGEWVTYLDDDDAYVPEKIAVQLERAERSGADLVLCGYTVVLPRRRRTRQTGVAEYHGDALLVDAAWCTPVLFHRRDPRVCFNEALRAGDDEVFAHAYLVAHDLRCVPNCQRSLVEVYPQIGAKRVHANTEASWHAARVNWRQSRQRYSREAWRAYLAMGRLVRAQGGYGSRAAFARRAWAALVTRGPSAWRLVLNATAHRLGILSHWVVS